MYNGKKIIIAIVALLLSSCSYHNPKERNSLVFKYSEDQVYDSLKNMIGMLSFLPEREDGLNRNYKMKSAGQICINGDRKINNDNPFSLYLKNDVKDRFVANATFLKLNGIDGAYFSRMDDDWIFLYRYSTNYSFDDSRSIRIYDPHVKKKSYSSQQILDQKDNIYLMAPIDAKIR